MRMKWLVIAFILLSLLAVACQRHPAPGNIIDDLGRSVRLDKVPQRIVSLSPSNTEIVFALGLDDKLVGVTTFCDYPEAAKAKPKVADFSKVDMERVVSVQPDLVLATQIHKEMVIPALERLGIPVLGVFPETLEKLVADISLIGVVTGK
ncbi:MAG: helical backbone metal receptor, partial [Dehalococcoidia bacterium]|nr:helical backbone metal receptor [Dehalococcoidia bacterium]